MRRYARYASVRRFVDAQIRRSPARELSTVWMDSTWDFQRPQAMMNFGPVPFPWECHLTLLLLVMGDSALDKPSIFDDKKTSYSWWTTGGGLLRTGSPWCSPGIAVIGWQPSSITSQQHSEPHSNAPILGYRTGPELHQARYFLSQRQ